MDEMQRRFSQLGQHMGDIDTFSGGIDAIFFAVIDLILLQVRQNQRLPHNGIEAECEEFGFFIQAKISALTGTEPPENPEWLLML